MDAPAEALFVLQVLRLCYGLSNQCSAWRRETWPMFSGQIVHLQFSALFRRPLRCWKFGFLRNLGWA